MVGLAAGDTRVSGDAWCACARVWLTGRDALSSVTTKASDSCCLPCLTATGFFASVVAADASLFGALVLRARARAGGMAPWLGLAELAK